MSQIIIYTDEQTNRINRLIESSKSKHTLTAFQSDWDQFTTWCTNNKYPSLPSNPSVIILYLEELSQTHKYSSIRRKLSSISMAHRTAKINNPTRDIEIEILMSGIGRVYGKKETPKLALLLEDIAKIVNEINVSTLTGLRDRAILLIGFSSASRRSEIVGLDIKDIELTKQGMDIEIFQSKSNEWITKSILSSENKYCPINALKEWLFASNIKEGAIFRRIDRHNNLLDRLSDQTVAVIVKKYAELAGLDPSLYSGHSLRSGLATSAAEVGMNDSSIMNMTGHKTRVMVDRYVHSGNKYKNNASSILKLL